MNCFRKACIFFIAVVENKLTHIEYEQTLAIFVFPKRLIWNMSGKDVTLAEKLKTQSVLLKTSHE